MGFHPYLNFGGNCREAFTRYQEIFGGELTLLSWSDMPGDAPVPAEQANLVMHGALTVGEDLLMGADAPPDRWSGIQGTCVNYSTDNKAEAERVYKALADGGEEQMPLAESFFSPAFGMCIDRYGTPWMVNTWQSE
jgi:PhnB protein